MIEVTPIPIFEDNYIWLIQATSDNAPPWTAMVDPGDADAALCVLKQKNLRLDAILNTHRHWDHVDGIEALVNAYPKIQVYGPWNSPVRDITVRLKDGDTIDLPDELGSFHVFATPGHTLEHICYYIDKHLFCGDTLFSAGCGRLEGSPEQMMASLNKLTQLPTNTYVYCAHEYTQSNLHFAMEVEPSNTAIQQHADAVATLRQQGKPSLPSTLAIETAINPFLRCDNSELQQHVEHHAQKQLSTPLEVFTELRRWKDNF